MDAIRNNSSIVHILKLIIFDIAEYITSSICRDILLQNCHSQYLICNSLVIYKTKILIVNKIMRTEER